MEPSWMRYVFMCSSLVTVISMSFSLAVIPTGRDFDGNAVKHDKSIHIREPNRRRGVRSKLMTPYDMHEDPPVISQILEFIENVTADPTKRCGNNGTKKLTLDQFRYNFPRSSFKTFESQIHKAVDTANILTAIFSNKSNTDYFDKLQPFLSGMLQAAVESNSVILASGIVIHSGSRNSVGSGSPDASGLYLFSYRKAGTPNTIESRVLSVEQIKNSKSFFAHKGENYSYLLNRKYQWHNNSVSSRGPTPRALITASEALWDQPVYSCLLRQWIASVSVPFFEMTETSVEFRGVVKLDIDLNQFDLNQCSESDSILSNSHRCRPETTKCVFLAGRGLTRGSYECQCEAGFYFPDEEAAKNYYNGADMERDYLRFIRNISNIYITTYQCLPCRRGCDDCQEDRPCIVEFNILFRGIPLGIQSFCMTITLVLGFVIVRLRKTKVMVASMWILLEIILLGALLLYATVVVQYFEPTTTTCLIVPWFREVGFAIVYGALLLKIYRVLAEFQSRKAHRVHVRDKDLLKYLLIIFIVVVGFMSAWTAVNIDYISEGSTLLDIGETIDKEKYSICKSNWWDYVVESLEFLYLCFGVYLCYCIRSAPSDYSESRYITAVICYELVLSTVFQVLRHLYWVQLHPDYLFLMYFLRCQLTVTMMLILILGPKLWFAHRPCDEDHFRSRTYSHSDVHDSTSPETMKLNVGISSNGDVDVGEISLADMDPEDIRAELKRLYTQLQIYRTKTMRKDNPHISKRRGGRKQTHRRFSLQAFHHKHRHHHEHDHEVEMSKTPEESTNSAEGFPMASDINVKEDSMDTRSPPAVSFKTGHK